MNKNDAITELLKHKNTKIFSSNEEAIKFCNKLKEGGVLPFKYTIVVWGE